MLNSTEIRTFKSAAHAMAEASALVLDKHLFIGIICKGNGYHRLGISDSDDWSVVCGDNEEVVGSYNVSHMSPRDAMFAALQMSEEAKEAKEFGLGKDHVNRLLDQTGRKFENKDLVVVKLAA